MQINLLTFSTRAFARICEGKTSTSGSGRVGACNQQTVVSAVGCQCVAKCLLRLQGSIINLVQGFQSISLCARTAINTNQCMCFFANLHANRCLHLCAKPDSCANRIRICCTRCVWKCTTRVAGKSMRAHTRVRNPHAHTHARVWLCCRT